MSLFQPAFTLAVVRSKLVATTGSELSCIE